MHVSKLMGILAHIIRSVNHREKREGWTEKEERPVSTDVVRSKRKRVKSH